MDFARSNEVFWNIPSMFPVRKINSYIFGKGKPQSYVEGHCNNRPVRERRDDTTLGVLLDVARLESLRASLQDTIN